MGQNQLNRLQMVQFEFPRVTQSMLSSILDENPFPILRHSCYCKVEWIVTRRCVRRMPTSLTYYSPRPGESGRQARARADLPSYVMNWWLMTNKRKVWFVWKRLKKLQTKREPVTVLKTCVDISWLLYVKSLLCDVLIGGAAVSRISDDSGEVELWILVDVMWLMRWGPVGDNGKVSCVSCVLMWHDSCHMSTRRDNDSCTIGNCRN